MQRIDRDRSELDTALLEQLAFLRSSARALDGGEQQEYKRLALALRILLHTGRPPSIALLEQLGVLDQLPLLDTAGENPETNLAHQSLRTRRQDSSCWSRSPR